MLVTQLDVYTEEKFEDEEDMRDRAKSVVSGDLIDGGGGNSELVAAFNGVARLANEEEHLARLMAEVLRHCEGLLGKDVGL